MSNLTSYINHNAEYEQDFAFEREQVAHEKNNSDNFKFLYQDDVPHGNILDKYELNDAVDIGCGTGWFANYLVNQKDYKIVYAIEPSQAAVDIAKKLYPDQKKVKYVVGFAEEVISKLKLKTPTLFSTMCVLAHIPDEPVIQILEAVDQVAPIGSVLTFSEPWGPEYHRDCWHIRDAEWWSNQMPEWEFEFYANYLLPDPSDQSRYKGFSAIKS